MLQSQQPGDRPRFRRSSTMKIPQDRPGFLKKARQKALALIDCIQNQSLTNLPNIKLHLQDTNRISQALGDD